MQNEQIDTHKTNEILFIATKVNQNEVVFLDVCVDIVLISRQC
jgi:hypothetical protein